MTTWQAALIVGGIFAAVGVGLTISKQLERIIKLLERKDGQDS